MPLFHHPRPLRSEVSLLPPSPLPPFPHTHTWEQWQHFPRYFGARIPVLQKKRSTCNAVTFTDLFLWDVKEPTLLFEKSRGRRPRWCGQPLRVMGLGRDGTLHGTYESRSCLFPLGRPVSRKACKTKKLKNKDMQATSYSHLASTSSNN